MAAAEEVSALVEVITNACVKYESFESLKEGNENFRRSMMAVCIVLKGVSVDEGLDQKKELKKALKSIEHGVKAGLEVMEVCSKRDNKLRANLFSETYIAKLKSAGAKMYKGLSMLASSGVSIQAGESEGAKCVLRTMKSELMSQSNDVADLLQDVVMNGLREIPDQFIVQLIERDVVSCKQDCYEQIREIQRDEDGFLTAKETYDEELLHWVMNISLSPARLSTALHSIPMSQEIERLITCPLTLELMKDPVMIVQSEQTCDQEPLCQWLMEHPNQCPVTGQKFCEKLEYKDNLIARQLLMHFLGDDAYQKYKGEKTIHLPTTSALGIDITGTPPVVTGIAESSPLRGEDLVGMAIDTFVLLGGPTYMELSTEEFGQLLQDTNSTDGRLITLKNPATAAMSKRPDEVEVKLPSGVLGCYFVGTSPKVKRFDADSPVRDKIPVGLVVDTLTLEDGTSYSGLSNVEFVKMLADSTDSSERVLLLKNPATRKLSIRQIRLPDEKTVTIPGGYLGVTFAGEKAAIISIEDDSPLKAELRVGMAVDMLTLPDGSLYSGLSAPELANALRGSAIMQGRELYLVNPGTMKLSDKLIDPKSSSADAIIEDTGIFVSARIISHDVAAI